MAETNEAGTRESTHIITCRECIWGIKTLNGRQQTAYKCAMDEDSWPRVHPPDWFCKDADAKEKTGGNDV